MDLQDINNLFTWGAIGILLYMVITLILKVDEYRNEVGRHGAAMIQLRDEVLQVKEMLQEWKSRNA